MILAAGEGRRFGSGVGQKLLAPFRGKAVVSWAVQAAVDSAIGPTWVVGGAADLSGLLPAGVQLITNEHWADGQATSLQAALSAARVESLEAVVVGLGDQPLITPPAWRAVAASSAPIAVATYDGIRRNPVRLSAEVWDLLPTSGDEGARVVFRDRPDLVEEVPCEGEPADIDTREDLCKWS
ncbi:MAG TPA: nucleotidyltransferase family protein [Acidimicrobiales bacterium]|nr:nucleotidyltransferase family protein [Acidimicrobiales bacterium]